jgi:hypothetical protein
VLTISDKSAIRLHPLERQVLEKLFTKTDTELSVQDLNVLEMQLKAAIILSREMTGHGFYTKFLTAENVLHLPGKQSLWLGTVSADVPGLNGGAGFQLHIKEGAVSQLEGFSFGNYILYSRKSYLARLCARCPQHAFDTRRNGLALTVHPVLPSSRSGNP